MIVTFEEWVRNGVPPGADVCIVGAGAAGLDLAVQLARGRRRVLVLEGGGRAFDPRVQRLHRFRESGREFPGGNHDFRSAAGAKGGAADEVRVRAFGGTTTTWFGKWKLPDAVDFEERPWVAPQGWPIAWSELEPLAHDVLRDYGVPFDLLTTRAKERKQASPQIAVTRHFEQQTPVDFGAYHAGALEKAENITVVLGANVVELLPAPGGARVGEVVVRALGGGTARVAADDFVLAVGGIETARLMLASSRFGRRGPGNVHGHVGRGFIDHPKARLGRFLPTRRAASAGFFATGRAAGKGVRNRLVLAAERLRELQLPNHAIGLVPLADAEQRGLLGRMVGAPAACDAILFLEQLHNPASCVTLDEERDELGMPLAEVHWDFLPADEEGARRFVEAMKAALEPAFGKLEIDESALSADGWSGSSHHMGTARMAATERDGVVDRDARVHGLENLFVAGSAVFPVGGNANPMVLLLALTRRLARHLER